MKRILFVFVALTFCFVPAVFGAVTKTVNATVTWDGKDTSSATEASFPAAINLYQDGTTPVLKSTINVTGACTNSAMPSFTMTVPDNVTSSYNFYATVTDAAGNVSVKSAIVTLSIKGTDTVPPTAPTIKLILQ